MLRRSPLLPGLTALLLLGLSPPARATNYTWSGGGTDSNWGTTANWGGTALAAATTNNLTFSGANRLTSTNNLSNLTNGWVRFANGDFTLQGNALTLNPSSGGMLTNSAGTNTIALDLNIVPNNKVWSVASGSELRMAGSVTHTSGVNPLITLYGGGTIRITSTDFTVTRAMTLNQGAVVVDGGFVDHSNDGIRFVPAAGGTVETRLRNNGTWRIGGGGNFRMGFSGAAAGSMSQMFLESGTLELYGSGTGGNLYVSETAGATSVFNQNGGLVWFSGTGGNAVTIGTVANADGTYNLNGGVLWTGQIVQGSPAATNAVFNLNGGTLKPLANSTTFFQGVQSAFVKNGGVIIDTTNFNITIAQNLQAGGSGGLTKVGAGTLTLSGTNTYAGVTVVSNGSLSISGRLDGAGAVTVAGGSLGGSGTVAGPVTVQASGTLSPGVSVGTLTLQSNLVVAGTLYLEINKSAGATNDFVSVSGSLTNSGGATVLLTNPGPAYVVGDSFKFFNKAMANGGGVTVFPPTPGAGMNWTNRLAADGSIGIVASPSVSTPADLTGLTLNPGTLSPAFNSNILSYTSTVAFTNDSTTVAPVAAVSNATIRVICNGLTNLVAPGGTALIALKAGANVMDVRVTAPDNSITKDYVATITRTPPNVILFLADDQGFSDWGCYGSEIATPNLDRLAAEGLRFRNFHNGARCSPTRCSVLTGLYPQQAAVDPTASLPNLRNDNNVTIAELLGANGYRTYMAGKWHIGASTGLNPWQRGFQQFWGFPNGDHADEWDSTQYSLVSSDGSISNRTYGAGQFYQPDAIGDYCLDFLTNHLSRQDGKPFFMYVPFGSAHFYLQAPKSLVDSNTPVYAAGWDVIRTQRYSSMLAEGVIDSRYAFSPRGGTAPWSSVPVETIPDWNSLSADRQADLARRMAIYASMVHKMDENIGRIVETLRGNGQLDNTLIFALSDNGGNYEGGVYGLTGGTANAAPLTGSSLDNMGQNGQPIIYLGGGWANVNDTPFRLFKHFDHGGGIRTPLIVHWPQGLTRTNQWEDQSGHLIDIMATIVDATGSSYPTQYNSHAVLPLEGLSLKPLFTNHASAGRVLGFEHEGNRAWISNSWKLVTKNFTLYDGSSPANELELYDLSQDPVEMTNLAVAQPLLLTQMATNWNAWAARVGLPASRYITVITNLPPVSPAPGSNDLFLDTFARPNNTDTDLGTAGMSGSRVPPLGTNATYYEGYEGSGDPSSIQILNGTLQMAVGFGMSENGIMHNFVGQDIVDAGGFSVEITVQNIDTANSDAVNRYAGFGVGFAQAEAATGADVGNALPPGTVAFRGEQGGNLGVSDFFVELDLNGNVKVWSKGTLLDTVSVGQNVGTLTASFALGGFTTNDTVTVSVFFNGQQVDINTGNTNSLTRTFKWDRNDSNYIGLSARASNLVQMDNLAIRKLPLANGFVVDYAMRHGLSGLDTAPNADPDGDGVSNFGEWAFGGDPTALDSYIAKLSGALVTTNRDFQFEFQRLSNAASLGLRYRCYISDDLAAWTETTPVLVSVEANEDNPGYEVVVQKLPAAVLANPRTLYLRVLAEPGN